MTDVHAVHGGGGAAIGYRVEGSGPRVLLVHGAGTTSGDWVFIAPCLRDRFTLVTMDRRGRGSSGDSAEYSMDLEAQDVLAVMEAVGAEHVVAHSYGALCSVVAASRTDRLRSLVLYEPPIAVSREMADAVAGHVEAGAHVDVLEGFLQAVGIAPGQLAAVRASAAWNGLLATVPTLPRELAAASAWTPPGQVVRARTLYLLGGETTDAVYLSGLEETQAVFADLRTALLPGQLHVAHVFAAESFAQRVADFIDGHS